MPRANSVISLLFCGCASLAASFTLLRGADSATLPASLALVREANGVTYDNLKSVVCREEIHRFKGTLTGENSRPIDTVTANISFESGNERYSDIRQNSRKRNAISSLSGAWSQGELGTLLSQTLSFLRTQQVNYLRNEELNGQLTSVYQFDVSAEESPWDLVVDSEHFRIGFRTVIWASTETGDLLKISRSSISIPPDAHISELQWDVFLQRVPLNGYNWLLPRSGEYAVTYEETNRREWNQMSFTDYRRYGAEIALRFDNVQ